MTQLNKNSNSLLCLTTSFALSAINLNGQFLVKETFRDIRQLYLISGHLPVASNDLGIVLQSSCPVYHARALSCAHAHLGCNPACDIRPVLATCVSPVVLVLMWGHQLAPMCHCWCCWADGSSSIGPTGLANGTQLAQGWFLEVAGRKELGVCVCWGWKSGC